MTERQGWHFLGIAWLAMAAFDKPIDGGSLFYVVMSFNCFIRSIFWGRE